MRNDASVSMWDKANVVETYKHEKGLFKAEKHLLSAYFESGMRVLDIGCGPGRVAAAIVDDVEFLKGIDISEGMVKAFRENFPQCEAECCTMEDIKEASNSYDMVLIPFNCIDYVRSKEKRLEVIRLCYDILKPGGILIFSSHNTRGAFGVWLYSRNPRTWAQYVWRIIKGEAFASDGYFNNFVFNSKVSHYFGCPQKIIEDVNQLGFTYLVQYGGNLGLANTAFNYLLETWIYYAFRKPEE